MNRMLLFIEEIYIFILDTIDRARDGTILLIGKTPSHYECVWAECPSCGAPKKTPCKWPWRCASRETAIKYALVANRLDCETRAKQRSYEVVIERAKTETKHWT